MGLNPPSHTVANFESNILSRTDFCKLVRLFFT